MGKIITEIRGFRSEAILDDEIVERIYNALPAFASEKGQMTLSELKQPQPKSEEKKTPAQKRLLKEDVSIPTIEEVRDFIKSRPNYEFSLAVICNHFLGFTPSSVHDGSERRTYDKMFVRATKAKQLIKTEENGEWTSTTINNETIYKFEKPVQEASHSS